MGVGEQVTAVDVGRSDGGALGAESATGALLGYGAAAPEAGSLTVVPAFPQLRPGREVVLVGAIDLARAAAEETADDPADVGEYAGVVIDAERLVTHYFAATMPGYPGWCWAVTLSRASRARYATVCEVALLPQAGALLAPTWLPWAERLRPEDIGVGDVLPFRADDPRLVSGWRAEDDSGDGYADLGPSLDELAVARQRVLSQVGGTDAAQRWYRGSHGPTAPVALAATAACQSCGYLVRLAGSLGQMFGVCANEWSPDDGQVVSFDHGCGAHSETDVEPIAGAWPDPAPPIDDLNVGIDVMEYEPTAPSALGPEENAREADSAAPSPLGEQPEQPEAESDQAGGEPTTRDDATEQVQAPQLRDAGDQGGHEPEPAAE